MENPPSRSSLLDRALRFAGHWLGRVLYRIRPRNADRLPAGGFLLLPNHLTWIDAIVLQQACPRPIRFIVDDQIYKMRLLNPIFRAVGAIPISSKRAKDGVRTAVEQITAGEIVCIFPEGELSRSGSLLRLKRGYELIARQANAPVVPVWLDQLWGSIFSFEGGRYFFKWPKRIPYAVTVAFGEPIAPEQADIATVRERFLELGESCFHERPHLQPHLGEVCIRGLKKNAGAVGIIDGMDGTTMKRGTMLAASLALSRLIRSECPHHRIGIVLPPGKGSVIANLAVTLAGKVPVNLNFTAGRSAVAAAMRIGHVQHCITAHVFAKRLGEFPWPEHCIFLEDTLPRLKPKIVAWRVAVALVPTWILARIIGLPLKGGQEEAVILFTSGSSGEPKGVTLSHRNVLGNVSQFSLMLNLTPKDSILACLPFFHSFGCTVTLWYPIIDSVRCVTYPNPLEIAKNAELIRKHQVTVLCTTPTFLRGYLRKAEPAELASLELLVTGAEKLPDDLAIAVRERFGKEVLQGYGLTETAPVVSVNLPDPKPYRVDDPVQPSSRRGSVGKLAPGMAAQIREPESGVAMSLHETGMLWLRGPNIFEGYIDDPARTAEVIQDGWFKTGDLARFDEDGFLFIEGRLSRFSKIAGEMVPHETIETKLYEVLDLSNDERVIAITAIPDEAKGEALVLLTATDLDSAVVREKLTAAGMPNLWIPKKIKRVEAIPVLGSGKLDLAACKEMALAS